MYYVCLYFYPPGNKGSEDVEQGRSVPYNSAPTLKSAHSELHKENGKEQVDASDWPVSGVDIKSLPPSPPPYFPEYQSTVQKYALESVQLSGSILGAGNYGFAMQATYHSTPVTAKFLCPNLHTPHLPWHHEHELETLSKIAHRNVVQFLGTHKDDSGYYVIMAFVAGGSICQLVDKLQACQRHVSLSQKMRIFIGIGRALKYLHNRSIIHQDLTSSSVLLTEELKVKLSLPGQPCTLASGHHLYKSPEALGCSRVFTEKGDIFSLAVIIMELINEEHPRLLTTEEDEQDPRMRDIRDFYTKAPKALHGLVVHCLHENPKMRPYAAEIVQELKDIKDSLAKHKEKPAVSTTQPSSKLQQPCPTLSSVTFSSGAGGVPPGAPSSVHKWHYRWKPVLSRNQVVPCQEQSCREGTSELVLGHHSSLPDFGDSSELVIGHHLNLPEFGDRSELVLGTCPVTLSELENKGDEVREELDASLTTSKPLSSHAHTSNLDVMSTQKSSASSHKHTSHSSELGSPSGKEQECMNTQDSPPPCTNQACIFPCTHANKAIVVPNLINTIHPTLLSSLLRLIPTSSLAPSASSSVISPFIPNRVTHTLNTTLIARFSFLHVYFDIVCVLQSVVVVTFAMHITIVMITVASLTQLKPTASRYCQNPHALSLNLTSNYTLIHMTNVFTVCNLTTYHATTSGFCPTYTVFLMIFELPRGYLHVLVLLEGSVMVLYAMHIVTMSNTTQELTQSCVQLIVQTNNTTIALSVDSNNHFCLVRHAHMMAVLDCILQYLCYKSGIVNTNPPVVTPPSPVPALKCSPPTLWLISDSSFNKASSLIEGNPPHSTGSVFSGAIVPLPSCNNTSVIRGYCGSTALFHRTFKMFCGYLYIVVILQENIFAMHVVIWWVMVINFARFQDVIPTISYDGVFPVIKATKLTLYTPKTYTLLCQLLDFLYDCPQQLSITTYVNDTLTPSSSHSIAHAEEQPPASQPTFQAIRCFSLTSKRFPTSVRQLKQVYFTVPCLAQAQYSNSKLSLTLAMFMENCSRLRPGYNSSPIASLQFQAQVTMNVPIFDKNTLESVGPHFPTMKTTALITKEPIPMPKTTAPSNVTPVVSGATCFVQPSMQGLSQLLSTCSIAHKANFCQQRAPKVSKQLTHVTLPIESASYTMKCGRTEGTILTSCAMICMGLTQLSKTRHPNCSAPQDQPLEANFDTTLAKTAHFTGTYKATAVYMKSSCSQSVVELAVMFSYEQRMIQIGNRNQWLSYRKLQRQKYTYALTTECRGMAWFTMEFSSIEDPQRAFHLLATNIAWEKQSFSCFSSVRHNAAKIAIAYSCRGSPDYGRPFYYSLCCASSWEVMTSTSHFASTARSGCKLSLLTPRCQSSMTSFERDSLPSYSLPVDRSHPSLPEKGQIFPPHSPHIFQQQLNVQFCAFAERKQLLIGLRASHLFEVQSSKTDNSLLGGSIQSLKEAADKTRMMQSRHQCHIHKCFRSGRDGESGRAGDRKIQQNIKIRKPKWTITIPLCNPSPSHSPAPLHCNPPHTSQYASPLSRCFYFLLQLLSSNAHNNRDKRGTDSITIRIGNSIGISSQPKWLQEVVAYTVRLLGLNPPPFSINMATFDSPSGSCLEMCAMQCRFGALAALPLLGLPTNPNTALLFLPLLPKRARPRDLPIDLNSSVEVVCSPQSGSNSTTTAGGGGNTGDSSGGSCSSGGGERDTGQSSGSGGGDHPSSGGGNDGGGGNGGGGGDDGDDGRKRDHDKKDGKTAEESSETEEKEVLDDSSNEEGREIDDITSESTSEQEEEEGEGNWHYDRITGPKARTEELLKPGHMPSFTSHPPPHNSHGKPNPNRKGGDSTVSRPRTQTSQRKTARRKQSSPGHPQPTTSTIHPQPSTSTNHMQSHGALLPGPTSGAYDGSNTDKATDEQHENASETDEHESVTDTTMDTSGGESKNTAKHNTSPETSPTPKTDLKSPLRPFVHNIDGSDVDLVCERDDYPSPIQEVGSSHSNTEPEPEDNLKAHTEPFPPHPDSSRQETTGWKTVLDSECDYTRQQLKLVLQGSTTCIDVKSQHKVNSNGTTFPLLYSGTRYDCTSPRNAYCTHCLDPLHYCPLPMSILMLPLTHITLDHDNPFSSSSTPSDNEQEEEDTTSPDESATNDNQVGSSSEGTGSEGVEGHGNEVAEEIISCQIEGHGDEVAQESKVEAHGNEVAEEAISCEIEEGEYAEASDGIEEQGSEAVEETSVNIPTLPVTGQHSNHSSGEQFEEAKPNEDAHDPSPNLTGHLTPCHVQTHDYSAADVCILTQEQLDKMNLREEFVCLQDQLLHDMPGCAEPPDSDTETAKGVIRTPIQENPFLVSTSNY